MSPSKVRLPKFSKGGRAMSKSYSGLFHGTLGTSYLNSAQSSESYSDRNIEIPDHIKQALSKLKKPGDLISGKKESFSMKDVSIMSKETGVEFAHITIGDNSFLIRGDKNGAIVPQRLLGKMAKQGGTLDFHSHPHDNDCVPSRADMKMIRELQRITGQSTSQIVTPNGRTITFNWHGVISTGIVPNLIDDNLKQAYLKLWR